MKFHMYVLCVWVWPLSCFIYVNEWSIEHVATIILLELSNDRRLTITLHTIFRIVYFHFSSLIFCVHFIERNINRRWTIIGFVGLEIGIDYPDRFHFHQISHFGRKILKRNSVHLFNKNTLIFFSLAGQLKNTALFSRNIFKAERDSKKDSATEWKRNFAPNKSNHFKSSAHFLAILVDFLVPFIILKQRKQLFSHETFICFI